MFALRTAAARAIPALAMRAAVLPKAIVVPAFVARAGSVSAVRAFSNSPLAWNKTDKNLVTAIESEIKHEEEQGDEVPDYITEYLKASPFEITNKVGSDEVTMTRKFGNEEIKIVFSVSDINSADDEEELDLEDDLEDNGHQDKESLSASGDDEEEGDDLESLTFPVRCLITITKPSAGSISIDAVAQDGAFIVESISNIKDSALAATSTAEADWEKRGLYSGPPFAELDENLQVEFEKYLEERQIDGDLANFVPNYVFHKDQVEYTHWLKDLKAFVSAK
ncbi:Mitochondrial acidic protein mam33 [Linnemannia elongata]|uniref:Mitochondrial glyco protein n=1 Tax=Linnemannia elongata AG-77 TaxID=1314771 RepID=A0A197JUM6_9FUNG|nr:Mitochondrial acidic protein mam33 [Linnemannia elongata]KAK5829545.1 mitochondrial glycoprotein [Linnemannia elongata]OAQ28678.1 mitochondrial glyco protein [Linnemannia elongata AG-77]